MARVTNKFIAPGIDAAKIGSGSVSNTEFGYLDGVTSDIQAQLDSKLGYDVISIAVSTSAAVGKTYLCTAGGITVTLPAASANAFVNVKDAAAVANANPITVATTGGALIDGASALTIDSNYAAETFVSDGTNWFRI